MNIKETRVNTELARSSKEIAEATMRDSATMRVIAAQTLEQSTAMKSIAEMTRRDSSAMKSIAVLTMIFLPATAVAVSTRCSSSSLLFLILSFPLFVPQKTRGKQVPTHPFPFNVKPSSPPNHLQSILDTPFFDYDQSTSRLVSQSFWIFWVVTIPLTIGVLTIWFLGVKLQWTDWLLRAIRSMRYPTRTARKSQDSVALNGAMFEMVDKIV